MKNEEIYPLISLITLRRMKKLNEGRGGEWEKN